MAVLISSSNERRDDVLIKNKIVSLSLIAVMLLFASSATFADAQLQSEDKSVAESNNMDVLEDSEDQTMTALNVLPTIEVDGYLVTIRGSARPNDNFLSAEVAAKRAIDRMKLEHPDVIDQCSVYMFYLDFIDVWSVHFDTVDVNERNYEYNIIAR